MKRFVFAFFSLLVACPPALGSKIGAFQVETSDSTTPIPSTVGGGSSNALARADHGHVCLPATSSQAGCIQLPEACGTNQVLTSTGSDLVCRESPASSPDTLQQLAQGAYGGCEPWDVPKFFEGYWQCGEDADSLKNVSCSYGQVPTVIPNDRPGGVVTWGCKTVLEGITASAPITITEGDVPNLQLQLLEPLSVLEGYLTVKPATDVRGGIVTAYEQIFAGNKTFLGTITASNLTGTNTGDLTLGSAPGLSLTGQQLTFDPAQVPLSSFGGEVTATQLPAGTVVVDIEQCPLRSVPQWLGAAWVCLPPGNNETLPTCAEGEILRSVIVGQTGGGMEEPGSPGDPGEPIYGWQCSTDRGIVLDEPEHGTVLMYDNNSNRITSGGRRITGRCEVNIPDMDAEQCEVSSCYTDLGGHPVLEPLTRVVATLDYRSILDSGQELPAYIFLRSAGIATSDAQGVTIEFEFCNSQSSQFNDGYSNGPTVFINWIAASRDPDNVFP